MGKVLAFGFRGGMTREAPELEAPGEDLGVNGFGGAWSTGGTISLIVKERVEWSRTGRDWGALEFYKLRLNFYKAPFKVSVRAPSWAASTLRAL
jgi:hypothetical protein